MSWEDRVREAAYTSPEGTRLTFEYEDVRTALEKRTTAFNFPGVDGAYVQDNGHGARQFPLRCFFSGPDHDLEANAFESALLERGVGRLEHPMYGAHDVVPFGSIERRDDLKTSSNQTIIEVSFWRTLGAVYPEAQADPGADVMDALEAFDTASAEQFAASTDLATTGAQEATKATFRTFLDDVTASLSEAAAATDSARRALRDQARAINQSLDVLIGQPLQLARQSVNLVRAPASAASGIRTRLEGYANLAARIVASLPGRPWDALGTGALPRRTRAVRNDFHSSDLFVLAAVSGSVQAAVDTQYTTRPAAITAADAVLSQFDAAVAWRDQGFGVLADVDTGGAYQALRQAAALVAGHLVRISFSLVPERSVILDRDRTIIDLAAELYGRVDDRLDLIINTNGLTGSEILELPQGRRIVYYP